MQDYPLTLVWQHLLGTMIQYQTFGSRPENLSPQRAAGLLTLLSCTVLDRTATLPPSGTHHLFGTELEHLLRRSTARGLLFQSQLPLPPYTILSLPMTVLPQITLTHSSTRGFFDQPDPVSIVSVQPRDEFQVVASSKGRSVWRCGGRTGAILPFSPQIGM